MDYGIPRNDGGIHKFHIFLHLGPAIRVIIDVVGRPGSVDGVLWDYNKGGFFSIMASWFISPVLAGKICDY
jgi:hypothetical protein